MFIGLAFHVVLSSYGFLHYIVANSHLSLLESKSFWSKKKTAGIRSKMLAGGLKLV